MSTATPPIFWSPHSTQRPDLINEENYISRVDTGTDPGMRLYEAKHARKVTLIIIHLLLVAVLTCLGFPFAYADGGSNKYETVSHYEPCPAGQTGYIRYSATYCVSGGQCSGGGPPKWPSSSYRLVANTCVVSNIAPIAADITFSTSEDNSGSFQLSVYDPDVGDSHTYRLISQPDPAAGKRYIPTFHHTPYMVQW